MATRCGLISIAICMSHGCETTQTNHISEAMASYRAGQYARSVAIAQTAGISSRNEADYVIGISSLQLGDLAAAAQAFRRVADSSDPLLSARGQAGLGLVSLRKSEYANAIGHLENAYPSLRGEDAVRAAIAIAEAFEGTDKHAQARLWRNRGKQADQSVRSAGAALAHAPGTVFTIQAGAFLDAGRAEVLAEALVRQAVESGLTPPRIHTRSNDRGQRFSIVQVGAFASRQEAEQLRRKLNWTEYRIALAIVE